MTRVCTAVLHQEKWVPQQGRDTIRIEVAPAPGKEVSIQGVLVGQLPSPMALPTRL